MAKGKMVYIQYLNTKATCTFKLCGRVAQPSSFD